jgi:hypothetical protein
MRDELCAAGYRDVAGPAEQDAREAHLIQREAASMTR